MTRFVAPDLASLQNFPAIVEVNFEAIRTTRNSYLVAALAAYGITFDTANLETDPLTIAFSEGGGAEEQQLRQRINEAVRALSLATSGNGDIEHIAATYYGISRQQTVLEDGTIVLEDLERFRDRIALAPEAFSTAGPLGAYIFHVLELDGVQDISDAWAYSEEDAATYTGGGALYADAYSRGLRATPFANRNTGDPVLAPEVLLVILPTRDYGPADQALLDRAFDAVTSRDVRPIGDNVRIEPAQVVPYSVNMTITYARGADPAPLIAEARRRIQVYTEQRRKVGVTAERLGIGGCGYVTGIESVSLTSPAADVGGGSKQAPECTSITVTAVVGEGTWE